MAESSPFVFVVDDLSVRRALTRVPASEGFMVEAVGAAEHDLGSGNSGRPEGFVADLQTRGEREDCQDPPRA
jgi:hypothetical protein